MKKKFLKSALSLLLALLLCASLMTPAVFAESVDTDYDEEEFAQVGAELDEDLAESSDDGDPTQVLLHANDNTDPITATITKDDVAKVFSDLELGSGSYYGVERKSASGTITNISGTLGVSSSTTVYEEDYTIYRTASASGVITKTPKWDQGVSTDITIRMYYTANFSVTGSDDGEIYLDGEAVSGSVDLFADTEYTVTAKEVEDFTYTINGASDGVAFAPTSDLTISADYAPNARATVSLDVVGTGTAKILVDGEEVNGFIPVAASFEVATDSNTDLGNQLDSIVVTKNGEEIEAVDGLYGPAANGDVFAVTVTFVFDPDEVTYAFDETDPKLYSSDFKTMFGDSSNYSYGYADIDTPNSISNVSLLGVNMDTGEYYIYRTSYNLLSPDWSKATKVMKLTLRSYYTGTFTVTGNDDGEIYLNGESVSGSVRLYTDTEYTVTAKEIDDCICTVTGAEVGVAFTPSADMTITASYMAEAYATITVNAGEGGSVEVLSNGEPVTDKVAEGDSFTVTATPNTDRGYKLDSIVVTKNGEEIESVEGAYGPAADGDEFAVTVTFVFDPDVVEYEIDANDPYLGNSDMGTLFGDSSTLLNTYGWASTDEPTNIHTVPLLGDGDEITAGDYLIFRTNRTLSSPDWSKAKILALTLRTYYNGTFTVTGHDDGEVYLNNEAVSGSVKLYTDTEYTVTAKEIEEQICTIYGVEEGVAFTPSQDVEVTASYMAQKYATITVNATEGGTVTVTSNGDTVFDKIAEGSTFEINIQADTKNAYYLESVTVTKDGEEIEAVDGVYGPVAEDEAYVIDVTFAQATLTLADCEVNLFDAKNQNYADIEAVILSNAVLSPEEFTEGATTKVEYVAYSILGYDLAYEPLNYTGALSHAFGTSEYGGEIKAGNTENIRVSFELANGIKLQATAVATMTDLRDPTTLECAPVTITYGDDLKAAIMENVAVYDKNGEPIAFTEDDITIDPETLNAKLLSFSAQEVTVSYGGDDINAACEGIASVYVNRAQCSIDTKSETITYGETPAAKVITDPEGVDYIRVIAGIDGDAKSFVSIDIPESTKELMKIKIGGFVLFDIYEFLQNNIGDGTTLSGLRDIVNRIYDTVNSSEVIRQAIESAGFDMSVLDAVIGFINELPEINTDLKIRLGQVPTNSGAYLMCAVTADINYTLDADVSYIIILPQGSTQDNTIELRYKSEIENSLNVLTYEEAQTFVFGGDLYMNGELYETDKIHALYVGTTAKGEVVADTEPIREPGIYTETIFIFGGNYTAEPLIRAYTIGCLDTELLMDDLTVTYDGEPHSPVAYTNDDADLTDNVTYLYYSKGQCFESAPVNAGIYAVYAIFEGDGKYGPDTACATLTIKPRKVIVKIDDAQKKEGEKDPEFTFTLTDKDETPLDAEEVGLVITRECGEAPGEYCIYVYAIKNTNYILDKEASSTGVLTIEELKKANVFGTVTSFLENTDIVTIELVQNDTVMYSVERTGNVAKYTISGVVEGTYIMRVSKKNHATREYEIVVSDNVNQGAQIHPMGDSNLDGVVNIKDVNALYKHVMETKEITDPYALKCSNVVDGEAVDIKDVNAIYKHVMETNPLY
ncbi:MAG: hypothetical protein IJJ15_02575 [Ruminococcus sp.]|nr:hypothetical protein [Ruminococcus sp.]